MKIDTGGLDDFAASLQPRQIAGTGGPLKNKPLDVLSGIASAELIEQAAAAPPDDGDRVEHARRLLLAGQLDSPQNIRAAAENIIEFGI